MWKIERYMERYIFLRKIEYTGFGRGASILLFLIAPFPVRRYSSNDFYSVSISLRSKELRKSAQMSVSTKKSAIWVAPCPTALRSEHSRLLCLKGGNPLRQLIDLSFRFHSNGESNKYNQKNGNGKGYVDVWSNHEMPLDYLDSNKHQPLKTRISTLMCHSC